MTDKLNDDQTHPPSRPSASIDTTSLRRDVETLKRLAISVPARILALVADEQPSPLTPGPCQEQHTLAAALDSIGCQTTARPATLDPTFDKGLIQDEL